MTFNQINYFLEVADQLNFTKAAASLFVTQSTLSRSIAALESEIGATLLRRDFHTVSLTSAGEVFAKEMRPIMRSINAVIRRVQAMDETSDQFVLGILEGQSVESNILFAIRNLSDKIPSLSVDIRRTSHSKLMDELLACKLNVVQTVISENTVLDDALDCFRLREVNTYLLAQRNDPILHAPFDPAALRDRILIVPEEIHPELADVVAALARSGITMRMKDAPDLETQSLWMEAGMGIYFGNDDSVIYTSRSFRPIGAVRMDGLPRNYEVLVWNKNCFPQVLEDFLSFIRMNLNAGQDAGSEA